MSTFQTNPVNLEDLLRDSKNGTLKLPNFQRGWVWDEERIKSLLASVSRSFPIGALMSLETGGAANFQGRAIEGAPDRADDTEATRLLLDGQQRLTSLHQSCYCDVPVETTTARHTKVSRWFYLDMQKCMDPHIPREDAIIGLPESRQMRADFGRRLVLDASTPAQEYECCLFPLIRVFDSEETDEWEDGFLRHWESDPDKKTLLYSFKRGVLRNFRRYTVPVITLEKDTPIEAVCLVFEKVNTGGKPLDTFELLTAMYAAQDYRLRDDWLGTKSTVGRRQRLRERRVLDRIASTDFLQVISLLHSKAQWREAHDRGKTGRDLPSVTATRQSLLRLPLSAYKEYAGAAEKGLRDAAKFLHGLNIFRVSDLPYHTQLVPLATVIAEIGLRLEHATARSKLIKWYWSGVFGELYGSATESRFSRDTQEVPLWLDGGSLPVTIDEAVFREDRLDTMRTRQSAAYKGISALLIQRGAKDFLSGQPYGERVFFDEGVDIHHIFPKAWCQSENILPERFNSIVNKTPLSWRTNRVLGGDAPSEYLKRLERGSKSSEPITAQTVNEHIRSHLIDPDFLRRNDFDGFYENRKAALRQVVEQAMGKAAFRGDEKNEPEEDMHEVDFDE